MLEQRLLNFPFGLQLHLGIRLLTCYADAYRQLIRNVIRVRLHHAEIRHGLGVTVPVGKGAESTALVCAKKGKTVDVACVDPSKAICVLAANTHASSW